MLNINQNFDLKAPVFNFDRDYFNSVEELNAYDTSNVPDHFVTNVAGMLYQFTEGAWVPMISASYCDTEDSGYHGCILGLIDDNCFISKNSDSNEYRFSLGADDSYVTIDSFSSIEMKSTSSDYPTIHINQEIGELYKRMWIGNSWDTGFGLNIEHQKYLDSVLQYSKYIKMFVDKELTESEQADGYSQVDMSLTDGDNNADINAINGFTHKTEDGWTSNFNGYGLDIKNGDTYSSISDNKVALYTNNRDAIVLMAFADETVMYIGGDEGFKISRPVDDTEGATITGIKSLTAFANPSATKVWATDGSTVDLATKADTSDLDAKANKSDVLLKKSARGGYYIRENYDDVGYESFVVSSTCEARGNYSFADGYETKAYGSYAHSEGSYTEARGNASHAEGRFTATNAEGSHSEGVYTIASGCASHAQGIYNIDNQSAIHSVGIGDGMTRKNAEYIYAKSNETGNALADDPKNGYKYLIGVGGYDGISTDTTTYKSVQEVIADLTARIEQLETKVRALEAANAPA